MNRSRRQRSSRVHLSEETLLEYLDGELDARQQEEAALHLRECWECRTLYQRLDAAVHAFMEERRDHLQSVAGEGEAREDFAARLGRRVQACSTAAQAPAPRRFRLRPLWPLGLAAAALAAVEGWRPAAELLRPAPALEIVLTRAATPAVPKAALATRSAAVAAPPPPRLEPPETPAAAAPAARFVTGEVDLNAAELAAYIAVHDSGLCRGEDVEVLRIPGRGVRVSGVVERTEQRARLEAALGGAPLVEITLIVASAEKVSAPAGAEVPVLRLEARPPLLRERIERVFLRQAPPAQAVQAMNEFSNQAVLLAATARWEAQALRRLADAFPAHRLRTMTLSGRARLNEIVEEHHRELESSFAQLGRLLDRLANPGEDLEDPPPVLPSGWPEGCGALDYEAARMDYLVSGLFAGLDLKGKDAAGAWRELRQAHVRALLLLRSLEMAAREEFRAASLHGSSGLR